MPACGVRRAPYCWTRCSAHPPEEAKKTPNISTEEHHVIQHPRVQHRGTGARQPPRTQHRDRGRGGRGARRGRFLWLPRHEQERQCAEGLGDEPGRDRRGRRHRPAVGGVHQAGQGAGRLRRHQGLPGLHERKPGARCGRPRHERVPAPAVPGQLQRAEQEEPAAARRCGDLPARPVFGVRRRQAQVHRPFAAARRLHSGDPERRDQPGARPRRTPRSRSSP